MESEGCGVWGAGCRVQGAGCRVQGAGCRVPEREDAVLGFLLEKRNLIEGCGFSVQCWVFKV